MYNRKVFTVLIGAFLILLTAGFNFQVRLPVQGGEVDGGQVLSQVELNLNSLNKLVHTRAPASEKVQALRSTLSQIESLRQQTGVQSVDKEVYMDYSVQSLEHVARDPAFAKEKCSEYKARILNDFEPYAEKEPSHPALKRSYQIIEGLCS